MIKERYCSYEVARLLKEKGFDESCGYLYCFDELVLAENGFDNRIKNSEITRKVYITAPTHQMACDWLREKGIHINIYYLSIRNQYYYEIVEGTQDNEGTCNSYGDAVEAALKYSLENLV